MKIKAKQRLHIGAAINHLKLAVTSENEREFMSCLRAAVGAIGKAGEDLAAEIQRSIHVDVETVAHAESLRTGGRFGASEIDASFQGIKDDPNLGTGQVVEKLLDEKPTGKK